MAENGALCFLYGIFGDRDFGVSQICDEAVLKILPMIGEKPRNKISDRTRLGRWLTRVAEAQPGRVEIVFREPTPGFPSTYRIIGK